MAWQDLHRAARKILPFEEDEAPYRRNHSPAGGRILRGMCSLGPTAVSASSISRFLSAAPRNDLLHCETDLQDLAVRVLRAGDHQADGCGAGLMAWN